MDKDELVAQIVELHAAGFRVLAQGCRDEAATSREIAVAKKLEAETATTVAKMHAAELVAAHARGTYTALESVARAIEGAVGKAG